MRLRILFALILLGVQLSSAQSTDVPQFESKILWVKVKPEFKDAFVTSNAKHNKLLQDEGLSQINSLVNPSLLNLHEKRKSLRLKNGPRKSSGIDLGLYFSLNFREDISPITIKKLKASGYFQEVEQVAHVQPMYMPNDELVDTTKAYNAADLKLINAYKAWDIEKGDTSIVIGVADLGADYTHIDLKDNIAYNFKDTLDGIDNDNDGYIDNFCGWDFAQNDYDVMTDPQAKPHGTYVSGVCSATPNNDTLLCGSGFNCKVMPLKISSQGAIFLDAAYNSILYAAMKGLKIINLSWTEGSGYSQIHQDIINTAVLDYDMAVVASAGNTHANISFYPASYEHVLSVAGSEGNSFWHAATYSNHVDLSAPSTMQILDNGNKITFDQGSSFSSPMAAGALGLVRSKFPDLDAVQAMERLRMAGTRLDTLPQYKNFKYLFGRRLDMYTALTSNPVSVRMTKLKPYSSNGTSLMIGDTVNLDMVFTNYLKPTSSSCIAKLKCDASFIQLLDSSLVLGVLNTYDSLRNVKSFRFVVGESAPELSSVKFIIEYIDTNNDYYDYQAFSVNNININYLDLDTNNITLSIINNGRIGYADQDATIGSGMEYLKANNSLYEGGLMLSTDAGKLSDCVREIDYPKTDFKKTQNIKYLNSGLADRHIVSEYIDTNANGVKIAVTQNSFAWKDANNRNQVIIEYKVKNISGAKINRLNAAVFTDWDIPSLGTKDPYAYSKNKVLWDSSNLLSIAYNTLTNGLYVGSRILTQQKPIFAALDNKNVNGKFTDTTKIQLLNAGISATKAGQNASLGVDVSTLIGVTIDSLENNQTQTFAISYLVSTDLLSLQNYSNKALLRYKQIRTSLTPSPITETVCKNTDLAQKVGSGSVYKFYKTTPTSTSNFIKSDTMIQISKIEKDTSFYITNHDDVFESAPALVKISIDNFSAANFNIVDIGFGKYLFYTNQQFKNITWFTGDDSVGHTNNYIHEYNTNGSHTVKLILESNGGCKDTSSLELKVSNVLSLIVSDIMSDEIELYPIPTKDKLYVEIPDNMQTSIHATLTNLIGVDVGEKYVLKNGKNFIDVSHLANGIYFINIFVAGKIYKYKFVVA
jgi:serine protease